MRHQAQDSTAARQPLPEPDPAPVPDPPVLRRSTRPLDRLSLYATLSTVSILDTNLQAVKHPCWQQAMMEELTTLQQNHTWDIVPCPSHVKPIDSKWVYSIKLKSDGSLDRYKAHLVALGNRQEYGVNYDETFAPVAKMTTV